MDRFDYLPGKCPLLISALMISSSEFFVCFKINLISMRAHVEVDEPATYC